MSSRSSYRVLGLTATPGSNRKAIQEVIQNLNIEHIELRTEDDPEILAHTHYKQIEFINTQASAFASVEERLVHEMTGLMKKSVEYLYENGIFASNETSTIGSLVINESFTKIEALSINSLHLAEECKRHLKVIEVVVTWRSILRFNGIVDLDRTLSLFRNQGHSMMTASSQFRSFITVLRTSLLTSKSKAKNSVDPKIEALKSLLSDHFKRRGSHDSRVIVFVHLRSTVALIIRELESSVGIRAHEFVGQSSRKNGDDEKNCKGLNQKEQREVLSRFNSAEYNVLVATSIAEEGLDINEVDLIITFDNATSPVRLVQRMGRTGRKRSGRVVVLVDSEEEQSRMEASCSTLKGISAMLRDEHYRMGSGSLSLPLKNLVLGKASALTEKKLPHQKPQSGHSDLNTDSEIAKPIENLSSVNCSLCQNRVQCLIDSLCSECWEVLTKSTALEQANIDEGNEVFVIDEPSSSMVLHLQIHDTTSNVPAPQTHTALTRSRFFSAAYLEKKAEWRNVKERLKHSDALGKASIAHPRSELSLDFLAQLKFRQIEQPDYKSASSLERRAEFTQEEDAVHPFLQIQDSDSDDIHSTVSTSSIQRRPPLDPEDIPPPGFLQLESDDSDGEEASAQLPRLLPPKSPYFFQVKQMKQSPGNRIVASKSDFIISPIIARSSGSPTSLTGGLFFEDSKSADISIAVSIPKNCDGDDDSKCCVCTNGESLEDNPIIFCEGRCHECCHVSCILTHSYFSFKE